MPPAEPAAHAGGIALEVRGLIARVEQPPMVLKEFEDADWDSLLALFRRYFGRWSARRLARIWSWQYRRNPYSSMRAPVVKVGLAGGEVIACMGAFPVPLRLGDRREIALCGSAFVVARGYRGLAVPLVAEFAGQSPVLCTGSSEPSRRLFARCGASVVQPSRQRFVYPLRRIGAMCRALRRRVPRSFKWIVSPHLVCRLTSRNRNVARLSAGRPEAGYRLQAIRRFGPEYDALWNRASGHFRLSIDRTSTYMNWRYLDCPGTHPICLGMYDRHRALAGAAVALAYAGQDGTGPPCGKLGEIVELVAERPIADDVVAHLVPAAMDELDRAGVDVIGVTESRPGFQNGLRRLGFVPQENDRFAMMLRLGQCGQETPALHDEGVYVTAGDGDALYVPAL